VFTVSSSEAIATNRREPAGTADLGLMRDRVSVGEAKTYTVSASFASFGGATFLGAVLASPCFVAWFEQLARIKRPAATPASHGSLALPTLPWQKNRTCVMSLMRTLLLSPADHRQAS